MGVVYKPFHKIVTGITQGQVVNIGLNDTAGSSIECTYAKLTVNVGLGAGTGFLIVNPSSSGKTLYQDIDADSRGVVGDVGNTSGGAGIVMSPYVSVAEVQTWGRDSFNALRIENQTGVEIELLISYGVRRTVPASRS